MELKKWLGPAVSAVALAFLAAPAQAAPVVGMTDGLTNAARENAGVEQVHRRYNRHYRHRHYRHHHYGYYRPYRYHRYHYYGYRPGIFLHFGHRRHHHHRRHWRW
jgi:hypothetical protein